MNNKRLNEIKNEIGEWAAINFKVHAPALGVLEEIGEVTHCILKRRQGIRGFENEDHFKREITDAVADIVIYALHAAYVAGVSVGLLSGDYEAHHEDEAILADLCSLTGELLEGCDQNAAEICICDILESCGQLGAKHGIDTMMAVESTWAKVSLRDWANNPQHAATGEKA